MKVLSISIIFYLLFIGCRKNDNTSVINNTGTLAVVNNKNYSCEIPSAIADYFRVNKATWELVQINELKVDKETLSKLKNCPLVLEGDFDDNGDKDIAIMARSKKIRYDEVKNHNYAFLLVFNNYEKSRNPEPLIILKGEDYDDEVKTVIYDQYKDGIWSYLSKENVCGKETIVVRIPESSSFYIIWNRNKNTYQYINSLDLDCNKNNTSKSSDSNELEKVMMQNVSSPENVTDQLIFTKDEHNQLQINTEILNYIQSHTTATDNAYVIALQKYVTHAIIKFYDRNERQWTEEQLIKIIAYASNTTDPLHKKLWKESPENWHQGMWGNILSFCYLVYPKTLWVKLQSQLKTENYYNLPNVKEMISYAQEFEKFGPP